MGKPRYKWYSYVRHILQDYPRLRKMHEILTTATITPPVIGSPRGSPQTLRATEVTALRELSPQEQKEYEAVESAVYRLQSRFDGVSRLKLISMVFFDRTHTLTGAAQTLYISYNTARRWQGDFLFCVAQLMGFL